MPAIKDVGTITAEELRQWLDYNPVTGQFKWRRYRQGVKSDLVAGSLNNCGYLVIRLKNRLYMGHRLAWLHFYGEWPDELIDHEHRERHRTDIASLRQATHAQNRFNAKYNKNNTSGIPGVRWDDNTRSWCAQLFYAGSYKLNKHFAELEDAIAARSAAEQEIFGEFVPERVPHNELRPSDFMEELSPADFA